MGMPANDSFDVGIVGGGIVGCAIARELSRHAVSVVLVEAKADVGFGTSKANSGIIHGGHHSSSGTLKGELEWSGNQMWDLLSAELGLRFDRTGDLTVAFTEEEREWLGAQKKHADERGVPGVELWDPARLHREEPRLSTDAVAALYGPTAGVVNPYEACFALIESAVARGVELMLGAPVVDITLQREGFWVQTPDAAVTCRFLINAAGLGASNIAAMAGADPFTLIARKGEEYLLDKRLRGLVRRIIFPCPTPTSKGILVIPTFDGTLMVGPTAEVVEDPDDTTTTHSGAAEVFAAVARLVPGISARDCIAEFAGVRAVAETGDFIIGSTSVPGFINVAGIQSPGLTAAPAIAKMVVRILREEGLDLVESTDVDASAQRSVRIGEMNFDQLAELVERNPSFGRVVCRCEVVTEGEVLEAIRNGARTLDGVKFRCRAGMGRCQGGFCTWRVVQVLATTLGIPETDVTKRGEGSWVVIER